jgi:hypothetical protein
MDLDAVQHTIEQACTAFQVRTRCWYHRCSPTTPHFTDASARRGLCSQNPALRVQAEHTILQFKQSQQPIPACQHILEKSGSVEARFHAAATIREAVIREWSLYSAEDILGLKAYILGYVLRWSAPPQLHVVRSSLMSSLAVVIKRAWRECTPAERMQSFQVRRTNVRGDVGHSSRQGMAQMCPTPPRGRACLCCVERHCTAPPCCP